MKHLLSILVLLALLGAESEAQVWRALEPLSHPTHRHENAMTAVKGKLYLVGGRGTRPVDEYDPRKDEWTAKATPPLEMHHFQAVAYRDELYVLGAFTGGYPHEVPIPVVYIYNPDRDEWRKGPEIPENRRRGAAGAVVHNNKIYLMGGIQDGHWDGHVAWLDEFSPESGTWRSLPDAPRARDHISVAVLDNKLYVAGGRRSTARIGQVLNTTIAEVDVFDFKTNQWTTLPADQNLPTLRAGHSAVAFGGQVLILGGESATQVPAHSEVEAYSPKTKRWERLPSLLQGRHGTGVGLVRGKLYIAAGSANRGGGPELNTLEVLEK